MGYFKLAGNTADSLPFLTPFEEKHVDNMFLCESFSSVVEALNHLSKLPCQRKPEMIIVTCPPID